jgi:hypothetical protein
LIENGWIGYATFYPNDDEPRLARRTINDFEDAVVYTRELHSKVIGEIRRLDAHQKTKEQNT